MGSRPLLPETTFTSLWHVLLGIGIVNDLARRISFCLGWSILVSFHSAIAEDRTSFSRMAKKLDVSLSVFHAGNFIYHILPLLLSSFLFPPPSVSLSDGVAAALLHCGWISLHGVNLDRVYVPMPPSYWKKATLLCAATNVLSPLITH